MTWKPISTYCPLCDRVITGTSTKVFEIHQMMFHKDEEKE